MTAAHSSVSVLAKHGKSFYFAGVFLPRKKLKVIAELYSFCRYVDDCADELAPEEARLAIAHIKDVLLNADLEDPLQTHVRYLENHGVRRLHLLELVEGAEWDLDQRPIHTADDLDRYCYHVAGVVGLMMNPLMQVTDPRAAPYAVALGKAMQLTNICRDVNEDAKNERTYLPAAELALLQLSRERLKKTGATPLELKMCVKKYLQKAQHYYELGQQGLPYIPWRSRFVILLASELYRHIGEKIIQNDYEVLQGRTYLSRTEKIVVMLKTLPLLLRASFHRKPSLAASPKVIS